MARVRELEADRSTRGSQAGRRKVPRAVREPVMLEMAGRVFGERGFHEASMDEIAEAAGISKPMLYSYFGSKEKLYFAYVDHAYQELISAIDDAVASETTPEGQLRAGTLAYYRYVGERRHAFQVLFREVGDPGGRLAQQRRRLARRVALAFEAILGPDSDAESLAEAELGAARALANWWFDHPEVSAEEITERLVTLVLVGLEGILRQRDQAPSTT
jgi:AcrR family transcriptional regulator